MCGLKSPSSSLPAGVMRFLIIIAVGVAWCGGFAIPVEGIDSRKLKDIAAGRNCLRAIQEVKKDPDDVEKVNAFTTLCAEFIDELDLDEALIKFLEKVGYKRGKKSKGTTEQTTDNKTEHEKNAKTADEKNKELSASRKQNESSKDQKSPSEKTHKTDKDDTTALMKEDTDKDKDAVAAKDTQDPEQKTLEGKDKKSPKLQGTEKQTPDSSERDKAPETEIKEARKQIPESSEGDKKTETQHENGKSPDSEPVKQTEQTDQKSIVEDRQEQHHDSRGIPSIDFTKLNKILGMEPEEIAKVKDQLEEIRKNLKIKQSQSRKHLSPPDQHTQEIHTQRFGFDEKASQQFRQDIPQFQHDWRDQFKDSDFDIPHAHVAADRGAAIPDEPTFQQEIPRFAQHQEFGVPPFPQHQPFDHDRPEEPPATEWETAFPRGKFDDHQTLNQQRSAEASDIDIPDDEPLSSKRNFDEL